MGSNSHIQKNVKKIGKNNISLSKSGMQSIETPNTTLFKQENGLFHPTICALNENHGQQKDRINTHMCEHGNGVYAQY